MKKLILGCLAAIALVSIVRAETLPQATIALLATGPVSQAAGLAAFKRIYEVVSHPRCTNCHTGSDNVPIWFGGAERPARPHRIRCKTMSMMCWRGASPDSPAQPSEAHR